MQVKAAKVQIELNFHSIKSNQIYLPFSNKVIVKTGNFLYCMHQKKSNSFLACFLRPAISAWARLGLPNVSSGAELVIKTRPL